MKSMGDWYGNGDDTTSRPDHIHVFYPCVRRPYVKSCDKCFKLWPFSACLYYNTSVGLVGCMCHNAELPSARVDKSSVAYSLDVATDSHMESGHCANAITFAMRI